MTEKQGNSNGGSWERPQLTLRLTAARKKRLKLLAAQERLSGGPGDAVDRALDLALSQREDDTSARVQALEEAVRDNEERRAREAAAVSSELAKVAGSLEALRRLIAEIAEQE